MADIEILQLPVNPAGSEISGKEEIKNVRILKVGAGKQTFQITPDGIFTGDGSFIDAPWRLTYDGAQYINDGLTDRVHIGKLVGRY